MICKHCELDLAQYAKGLCMGCYKKVINNKNKSNTQSYIYKMGRPLRKSEIEHNITAMYDRLRIWKKKNNHSSQ